MRISLTTPCNRCFSSSGSSLLALVLAVWLVFLPSSSSGQSAPAPVPGFEFAATIIGDMELPPLFYQVETEGAQGRKQAEFRELILGRETMGQVVRLPSQPAPKLWIRTSPEDAEKPTYERYMDIPPLPPGPKSRLLLVFYHDNRGRSLHQFLDVSAEKHPAGTVRMFNLTDRRIAFSAGGNPVPVPPGKDARTSPVVGDRGRFPFYYLEERQGTAPYESPNTPMRFRQPGQRVLVVFTYVPRQEDPGVMGPDGNPLLKKVFQPFAMQLYDTAPGFDPTRAPKEPAAVTSAAPASTPAVTPPPSPDAGKRIEGIVGLWGKWWANAAPLTLEFTGGGQRFPINQSEGPIKTAALTAGRSGIFRLLQGQQELSQGQLPEGADSVVIALAAPPDVEGACSVLAFDNSPQSHPPGTRRIFNLTPYQLAYSQGGGGEAVYVNPHEAPLFRESKPGAPIKLALQTPAGWILLGNLEDSALQDGKQKALFIYPEGANGKFNFQEVTL